MVAAKKTAVTDKFRAKKVEVAEEALVECLREMCRRQNTTAMVNHRLRLLLRRHHHRLRRRPLLKWCGG